MPLAMTITSGYVPLGAVVVSKAIADYIEDRPLPLGLTCSIASLNAMARE